jgi:hypothetical protein
MHDQAFNVLYFTLQTACGNSQCIDNIFEGNKLEGLFGSSFSDRVIF